MRSVVRCERLHGPELHQLRGRVGRGADQSHCVLLYKPPLGRIAKERLAVLRDHEGARSALERALSHDPEHLGALLALGSACTGSSDAGGYAPPDLGSSSSALTIDDEPLDEGESASGGFPNEGRYLGFVFAGGPDPDSERRYVDALLRELEPRAGAA